MAPVPPRALELEKRVEGHSDDVTLESLVLVVADRTLVLNWWGNHTMTDKSPLKTWGGQQTPRRVMDELLGLLDFGIPAGIVLQFAAYTKSRFGVDGRSAWEALDAGYSPNDLGQAATTYPWVEVSRCCRAPGIPARRRTSLRSLHNMAHSPDAGYCSRGLRCAVARIAVANFPV